MAGEQASRCNERKTDYQQSAQNGFVHRRVQQRKFSFMAYHHREKVFLLNHFRIFCFPRRQSRRIDSSRCLPKIHPFGQKNDRVGDEKKPIFVPCACNSSIVPTPPVERSMQPGYQENPNAFITFAYNARLSTYCYANRHAKTSRKPLGNKFFSF